MRKLLWSSLVAVLILAMLMPTIACTKTVYIGGTPTPKPTTHQQHGQTVWDVQWQRVTGNGDLSGLVGTARFPATFNYDWGWGAVYGGYSDYIGFTATATIKVQQAGGVTVYFTVGGDDGYRLYVDGYPLISDYSAHQYRSESATMNLSEGFHNLQLDYFELEEVAVVSFSCDSSVLSW